MQFTTSTRSFLLSTLLLCAVGQHTMAQLLQHSNGNLPSCGQSCSVLTSAQSSCGSSWSCFCSTVWSQSGGALTTMCAASCTNPSDNTAIQSWYTANCGSDNGASEHGGSSGGSGTTGGDGAATTTAGTTAPSTTGNSGVTATSANVSTCSGWFDCHWKWVVMIIVLAVGLTILGFGGRWLKKRHDRKKDRVSAGFNSGITERVVPQMAGPSNPSFARDIDHVNASPARTREAFMPYGYGYARSESRVGSGSPGYARGGTPVGEMEQGVQDPKRKSKRVLVRERSGDDGL